MCQLNQKQPFKENAGGFALKFFMEIAQGYRTGIGVPARRQKPEKEDRAGQSFPAGIFPGKNRFHPQKIYTLFLVVRRDIVYNKFRMVYYAKKLSPYHRKKESGQLWPEILELTWVLPIPLFI